MLRAVLDLPTGHQTIHLCSRLLNGYARFKPAHYRKKMRATTAGICRIKLKGQPNFNLIVAAGRKRKVARHHADYGGRLRIDLDLLADDVVFATERALPK